MKRRASAMVVGASSVGALCGFALGGPIGAAVGGALSAAMTALSMRQLGRLDAFQQAWVREDTDALRRLLPQLAGVLPRDHLRLYEATLLAFGEGRYEESLTLLDQLPPSRELGHYAATCRAWCLVHLERIEEAVEVAG